MARAKPDPSPEELFLAPLLRHLRHDPALETLVFWGAELWPDDPSEALESEEVGFYAEGLIPEGFHLVWQVLAEPGATLCDHARLYVWQDGPPPPDAPAGWQVLEQGRWTRA